MLNVETIFLYVFVFSILVTLRLLTKFISALLHPEEKILRGRELIIHGIFLSYFITYIIKNI
jgi:hypothetical protein